MFISKLPKIQKGDKMFISKFRLLSLIIFVLCGCMLSAANVEAQEVHALIVIMDADKSIGKSVAIDGEIVRTFLREVDGVYETHVKTLNSSQGATTKSNILREIRALRPGPQDIVLFYFSGHGGMVKQDNRTYISVTNDTDPSRHASLLRSDIEEAVTDLNPRLSMIITDCCSSSPNRAVRNTVTFAVGVREKRSKVIRNLFGQHRGMLHINGASEGQYGWCLTGRGGVFTEAFFPAISEKSDLNSDGFIEWSEVIEVGTKQTAIFWRQLQLPMPPRDPQATLQKPKVYSLPDLFNGSPTEFNADLWNVSNVYSDLKLTFDTNKNRYRIHDDLRLTVRANTDCYITLLNWDIDGNFVQLFPNRHDQNNQLRAGKTYTFPPRGSDYEFTMLGPRGSERLKVIAVADRALSNRINTILKQSNNSANPYRMHSVKAAGSAPNARIVGVGEVTELLTIEEEIAQILENMDSDDWSEARREVPVQ